MDLKFLDKASGVTPLLVRLYDNQKLYSLARDKKPEARSELSSAVVQLLGMDLSPRESELIADVLIELMRQAEIDLRMALASRMATLENVPLRLVLQMVNDEIQVAEPVLKESPVLGDMDLAYIIKAKGAEYWRAIAERKKMSDKIVEMLADTRDLDTAVTLVRNEDIHLSSQAVGTLSDIAKEFDVVAQPLLMRDEVDTTIAETLYRHVGAELKKYIQDNFEASVHDHALNSLDRALEEFVEEIKVYEEPPANDLLKIDVSIAWRTSPYAPTKAMMEDADHMDAHGMLGIGQVLDTLRQGRLRAFVAQLSVFSKLDVDTVLDILSQKNGQGLAVAARAFDILKSDFTSMYLLTNRIRNNGAPVNLDDMNAAGAYFDRITPEMAKRIIKDSHMTEQ